MTAIPVVANGQLIDPAAWGTPVANMLNQRAEFLGVTPGGNIDATTGVPMVSWLAMGNLTVPAWAASAIVLWSQVNVGLITGTAGYDFEIHIGTDVGRQIRRDNGNVIDALTFAYSDKITLTSTGAKALALFASRASGTGTARATTLSDIAATVIYLP